MSSKKEALTLSLAAGTKAKLEEIARKNGFFWGKSPSPSALVNAIASKELQVGKPFSLNDNQVKAFRQAIVTLIDNGDTADAEIVARHLLDKAQLEFALKKELIQLTNKHLDKWRLIVEEYIDRQQPFELLYKNSQGQELIFNVYFAQIDPHEKRLYLNIWCKETEDVSIQNKKYFPELAHNRCLRFDRILGIIPKSGVWRESLDYIEVHLQLSGWMVKAYKPREKDNSDKTNNNIRTINRRVFNPFWLIREIKGYGEYCSIVEPDGLKSYFRQELIKMCQLYDIQIKS